MIWKIEFQHRAVKQLEKLAKQDANRIVSFLADRVVQNENPRRTGAALQGSELGSYWVEIGHRRQIYR